MLVDRHGRHFLFRGPTPLLTTTILNNRYAKFLYHPLLITLQSKSNVPFILDDVYLVDYSLLGSHGNDKKNVQIEQDFFAKHPRLGKLIHNDFLNKTANLKLTVKELEIAIDNIHHYLVKASKHKYIIYFVHCTAGCDRTGAFIAAYNMKWKNYSFQQALNENMKICRRIPGKIKVLIAYCKFLKAHGIRSVKDCLV